MQARTPFTYRRGRRDGLLYGSRVLVKLADAVIRHGELTERERRAAYVALTKASSMLSKIAAAAVAVVLSCCSAAETEPEPEPVSWACTVLELGELTACTCDRYGTGGSSSCPTDTVYGCCKQDGELCTCQTGTAEHCETVLTGTLVPSCPND